MPFTSVKTEGKLTGTGDTTIYTCPASTRARIMKLTVVNLDVAAAQVLDSANLVPSGGAAADTNQIAIGISVEAADGNGFPVDLANAQGHILDPGDFIVLNAQTANKLTYHLSVIEKS